MIKFKTNTKYDVTVLGRAGIDLNATDINRSLDKSSNYQRYLGGSAGNTAVGLARHNLRVSFLSCVSDDQFGRFIIDYLANEKINTDHIQIATNGEKLGLAFTEIKSSTESSILMYREGAADLAFHPDLKNEQVIKDSKMLVISGTALAKSPSRDGVFQALAFAKKHNTVVVFDIDYRPYTWDNLDQTKIYYHLVAKQADIIIGSREEVSLAEELVLPNNEDDQKSVNYFFSQGTKLMVIKHGSEGSYAYLIDGSGYKVDIFPIKLLKSFGGGDAYASTFLFGLIKGFPIVKSLTLATAAAAIVVSKHSCSESLPDTNELEQFVASYNLEKPVVEKI